MGSVSSRKGKVGEGVSAEVFPVKRGEKKWAEKKFLADQFDLASFIREVYVGASLPQHDNLIHFDRIEKPPGKPGRIQMALAQGSLNDKLSEVHLLSWKQLVHLIQDIWCGLGALHAAGIFHMDIKPDNILVMSWPSSKNKQDERMPQVQLADYGLATWKQVQAPRRPRDYVTLWYKPPELLCDYGLHWKHSHDISEKIDVYSAGMTSLDLLYHWLWHISEKKTAYRFFDFPPTKNNSSLNTILQEIEIAQRMFLALPGSTNSSIWDDYCRKDKLPHGRKLRDDDVVQVLTNVFQAKSNVDKKRSEIKQVQQLFTILWETQKFDPKQRPTAHEVVKKLGVFLSNVCPEPISHLLSRIQIPKEIPQTPFEWVDDLGIKKELLQLQREAEKIIIQHFPKSNVMDTEQLLSVLKRLESLVQQSRLPPENWVGLYVLFLLWTFPVLHWTPLLTKMDNKDFWNSFNSLMNQLRGVYPL